MPVEIVHHPFTPLADAEGRPLRRASPYLPVLGACSLCSARCCRLVVKVSLPDVVHWCRTLGVPLGDAFTFVPSEDSAHAARLDDDPRLTPLPEAAAGYEIALRRRDDGGCRALVSIGEHERCGAYGARPTFCRTYPVKWRTDTTEGGPAAILCPIPYGIAPAELEAVTEEIERSIRYWQIHDGLVRAWNAEARPRTIEAFLAATVPRAADQAGLEMGPALAVGTLSERLFDRMVEAKVSKPSPLRVAAVGPRRYAGLPPRST